MAEQEQVEVISNRIQIRSGISDPKEGDLLPNELGYQKESGILYIGREEGIPIPVLIFNDDGNGNITVGRPEGQTN